MSKKERKCDYPEEEREPEEKCVNPTEFSDKDIEAIVQTNMQILDLTEYGMRRQRAKKKSTELMWSNEAEKWVIVYKPVNPNEVVELDANEILVPFSKARMQRLACHLKTLPLFYASIEAQARGKATRKSALALWLDAQPKEARESELYKALEQQYWEELTKQGEEEK